MSAHSGKQHPTTMEPEITDTAILTSSSAMDKVDTEITHPESSAKPPPRNPEDFDFQFFSEKELPKGTEIQNYLILGSLGVGGFGITYLARDQFLNRHIVLKENFPSSCAHRDPLTARVLPNNRYDMDNYHVSLRCFLNEARTLANLDHPNIVRVLSIFESNETAYYAMDFIDGVSLETLSNLEHNKERQKRYTEEVLLGLLWKMLDILTYLHGLSICHRDIKPCNILINHEGAPVLIDFGAARDTSSAAQTATVLASHGFSSPEQSLGLKQTGAWSDIYSLGATFFCLLIGRPPERSESRIITDGEIKLAAEPELKALYSQAFLNSIDKALAPHIDKRYRNAEEWVHDLPLTPAAIHSTLPLSEEDFKSEVKSHSITASIPTRSRRHIIANMEAPIYIPIERKRSKGLRIATIISYFFPLLVIFFFVDVDQIFSDKAETPQKTDSYHSGVNTSIDLNNIPIPKLQFSDDTPLSSTDVTSCQIRLDSQFLIGEDLMKPLPAQVTLSAINLEKGSIPPSLNKNKEMIKMVIYNENKTPIATSSNSICVERQVANTDLRYVFSSCPVMDTKQNYTAKFINENGEPRAININLVHNRHISSDQGTPFATYFCYPKRKEPNLLYTPLAKEIKAQLAGDSPQIKSVVRNQNSHPILIELAHMGNIWANFILYEMYKYGKGTHPDPKRAYIYLTRAGEAGCPQAQKLLTSIHSPSTKIFPDVKMYPSGVIPDPSISIRYLHYASQQSNALADILLSIHYAQGWGVRKSQAQAALILEYNRGTPVSERLSDISPNSIVLGIWTPTFLKAYSKEALRVSCLLTDQNITNIKGIRLKAITKNNDCTFSNIHVCYKGSTIYSHGENHRLTADTPSYDIPLIIPSHYHNIPAKDLSIDFFVSSKEDGYGVIELLKKDEESPKPNTTPSSYIEKNL